MVLATYGSEKRGNEIGDKGDKHPWVLFILEETSIGEMRYFKSVKEFLYVTQLAFTDIH
jgi:hypothetical protein